MRTASSRGGEPWAKGEKVLEHTQVWPPVTGCTKRQGQTWLKGSRGPRLGEPSAASTLFSNPRPRPARLQRGH